jgi:hypothetical protein
MPGFDPGRALTRPTGSFVLLRDVAIRLLDQDDAGESNHGHALVNRYNVDAVEADIMLGFFFPGARMMGEPPVTPEPTTGPPTETAATPATPAADSAPAAPATPAADSAPAAPASAAPTTPAATPAVS